jgi:hypothetical protein
MESVPLYKGKPTVYLDQNILDFFTKYGLGELGQILIDDYQVVYSDENLKEIRRSKGFEENFLKLLKDLNAYHLKIIVEQPNFTITDKAKVMERNPYDVYKEYCDNSDEGVDIEHAMHQSLFKFSGGRKGEGLNDIHKEQISAFSELMNSMLANSDELPEEIQRQLQFYAKEMTIQFKETLDKTERMMLSNIGDDKNWDGVKDFRSAVGIGPKQLNNIEAPNVLKKIWDELKTTPSFSKASIELEDFFQLKKNPVYPEQPYFKHQKVTMIYNMLNTLGYYPDSKVHVERRFVAALSDNSHASTASFCHYLLSNDESFIKKVRAVYEYLDISTIVKHVVFKDA